MWLCAYASMYYLRMYVVHVCVYIYAFTAQIEANVAITLAYSFAGYARKRPSEGNGADLEI
jgi:hypothetical protein